MLLDFTRKTYTQTAILFCLTILALWARHLLGIHPWEPTNEPLMPFASLLQKGMLLIGSRWSMVLAMLFTLCLAYLLMYILHKHDLLRRQDHLAAFIFILLGCSLPAQQHLGGVQIAAMLCLFALDRLLALYHEKDTAKHLFIATFLVGIAGLFYPPALLFFLVITVGVAFLKVYNWRDFFICLFGMLTPFLLAFIYSHIANDEIEKSIAVFLAYFTIDTPSIFSINQFNSGYFCVGYISVLCLVAAFTNARGILANIRISKMYGVLRFAFFVLAIGPLLFPAMYNGDMLILLAIPAAPLVVSYLSGIRKAKWANVLLVLLIASCILLQVFF